MRIPPEQMRALAGQLRSRASSFEEEQRALMSQVEAVRAEWTETASDVSFGDTMKDWHMGAAEVAESLREAGNFVERAGNAFEQLDQEIARAAGGGRR